MIGCGNDPRTRLTDADRAAVAEFRQYLHQHKEQHMPEPRTHDYGPGRRGWGHDYTITNIYDGGQRITASGWGPFAGDRIRPGDYLLLQRGDRCTRYQVAEVDYSTDPADMWQAILDFAPRIYATAEEKATTR